MTSPSALTQTKWVSRPPPVRCSSETTPHSAQSPTPYVATLVVLALFSQSLRMPAADGQVYRRGSAG